MLSIFKPAPHKARLPAAPEIDPTLSPITLADFSEDILWLYAAYLVRKNFALAMPYTVEQGLSRGDLGFCTLSLHRLWFSKFIMGSVIRSLESARFSAGRVDCGRSSHVVYGLCARGRHPASP